jgi:hypothetical protein
MRNTMSVAVNANNAETPWGDLGCCAIKLRKLLKRVISLCVHCDPGGATPFCAMQKWKAQALLQGQARGLRLLTIRLKRNLS